MARPFVSVLIDTYNHERFIEQAVVSVLQQDFPAAEREIVVVDDGSTDATPEIVRKFEPRVRLVRKANGGQASAFNAGIPACRGEIVAFLDGDDWWAERKLERVAEVFEKERAVGLVGHGITEVFADGHQRVEAPRESERLRLTRLEDARTFRLRKSFLGTSRMALRSAVLKKVPPVPEALVIEADEYLFTLGAWHADAAILREALTFYRHHEGNAFQISNGDERSVRRKLGVLVALAASLEEELRRAGAEERIVRTIADWVRNEADLIRLRLEGGFPWETVRAELGQYRVAHAGAPLARQFLKYVSLLPALVLPPQTYYALKRGLAGRRFYKQLRQRWLPLPGTGQAERYRASRP